MNHGTKNQWHYVLFGALTLVLNDEYLQVLHETLPLEAGAMP
jgi:hypothetical protein